MNKFRTALGILGLAFVLAACGSNSEAPEPDPEPEPDSFTVSGTVLDDDDNPLEGVTINFSGTSDTVTTNYDGEWESPELEGEVTVTPEHDDYEFNPEELEVDSDANDVNFTGTRLYTAAGTIRTELDANPVAGITISFSGTDDTVITDENGEWESPGFPEETEVTVTPEDEMATFTPSEEDITISGPITDIDFKVELPACTEGVPDSQSSPCIITRVEQLPFIADDLSGHYKLGNDIDASATVSWNDGEGFTPLGTFTGSLDGADKTISGLIIDLPAEARVGLFQEISATGIVENLEFEGSVIHGREFVGTIAAINAGIIKKVAVVNGEVGGNERAGGLVGRNDLDSSIHSSRFAGTVGRTSIAATTQLGGLTGENLGDITDSEVDVTIPDFSYTDSIGGATGLNTADGTMSKVTVRGSVEGSVNTGGIVGTNYGILTKSINKASVGGTLSVTGGVVAFNEGEISNSRNEGAVDGSQKTGGIAGSNDGELESVHNAGPITSNGADVGGVVGSNNRTVTRAKNTETVSGHDNVGGIAGVQNGGNSVIIESFNTGKVEGMEKIGGIAGRSLNSSGEITNSWNTGPVSGTDNVAGIVGENSEHIDRTFSAGLITVEAGGTAQAIAIQRPHREGTITKSYYDGGKTGRAGSNDDGESRDTNTLKKKDTYEDWDFDDIWSIRENADYPDLRDNPR